jgi:hypothetical protein
MDCEEMLFKQVQMTKNATPGTSVWVYRCSAYAYNWYTSVRTILDDPAYESWYIKCALAARPGTPAPRHGRARAVSHAPSRPPPAVKPNPPWFSPKCDNNFSPPKCSDYYHMSETSARAIAPHPATLTKLATLNDPNLEQQVNSRPATRTATATVLRRAATAGSCRALFTSGITPRRRSSTGRRSAIGSSTPVSWHPASESGPSSRWCRRRRRTIVPENLHSPTPTARPTRRHV